MKTLLACAAIQEPRDSPFQSAKFAVGERRAREAARRAEERALFQTMKN